MSALFVCLSVCLSVRSYNHMAELHQIFVHVAYGRGSVLVWRRCDTLCTSGFVDDLVFSHMPNGLIVSTLCVFLGGCRTEQS